MATNDEIVAKLPAVLAKLQETNERSARDAALAEKRKLADLKKQQTIANKKGAAKTRADLDAIQELKDLRKDIKDREAQQAEIAKSSAGQAIALKKELEKNGKVAENNKEFQKLSYQARKEDYAQRLANAETPAAKKEIREEARADAKKNGSRLDKIAAGIGGLFEMGKKGAKAAALGGLAILSTLAIGAFMIALGKFLQSDTFKKITAYIKETIIPFLARTWESIKEFGGKVIDFYTNYLEPLGPIFKKYFIDTWDNIKGLFAGLGDAFDLFSKGEWWEGIKCFFSEIGGFIGRQIDNVATLIYNLIASVFGLSKTDSVYGSIRTFVLDIYNSIVSFFSDIGKSISDFFVITIPETFQNIKTKIGGITDSVVSFFTGIFEPIVEWFGTLFNDPVGAIKTAAAGYLNLLTDFAGFVYCEAIKPVIDFVGNLFGVSNASKQVEGYVGKKLDKIINFAEEIYGKYIKPIVDWADNLFSSLTAPELPSLKEASNMATGFVKRLFRAILPNPDAFKFQTPEISIAGKKILSSAEFDLNPIPKSLYDFAGIDINKGVEGLPGGVDAPLPTAEQIQLAKNAEVARNAKTTGAGNFDSPIAAVIDAKQTSKVYNTYDGGYNLVNARHHELNRGMAY